MIPVEALRAENQGIEDLCQILEKVIEDMEVNKNPVVCELVERFLNQVEAHLTHESRSVYRELLKQGDKQAKNTLDQFMHNARRLKGVCDQHKKTWKQMREQTEQSKPEGFGQEFREFIQLVRDRISLENERLFPMFA